MAIIEEAGKWYDRCGDCGQAVKERHVSTRHNVCDECWQRRGWLVGHLNILGTEPRFLKIHSAMANHTGTAKRQIIVLQKAII